MKDEQFKQIILHLRILIALTAFAAGLLLFIAQ